MTDTDIIKALECCVKDDILEADNKTCLECPMNDDNACTFNLRKHTLDLINRLKAEIERLEKHDLKEAMIFNSDTIKRAVTEALKEFAERLKEKQQTFIGDEYAYKFNRLIEIDNLLKEMG